MYRNVYYVAITVLAASFSSLLASSFALLSSVQRPIVTFSSSTHNRHAYKSCGQQRRFMGDTEGDYVATTQTSIDEICNELSAHKSDFDTKISSATTVAQVEQLRVEYLGKKSYVNKAMSFMRRVSPADKPKLGSIVNEIKSELESLTERRKEELELLEMEAQMEQERIDVTMPGLIRKGGIGRRHPLSITMEKAVDIFVRLGYDTVTDCADSPEIETDYYCFEALNCPKDHPARDMQDTFYLTEDMGLLLRTHTSSVQIRQLEKRKPPLRIVAPGRVYRKDDIDATHSMIFHQVEILALEERGKLNLGHLKGTVEYFLKHMFGPTIEVRFRGSYFPFTEPSMEVDVFFRGKWLEVLGCGMVDPNVLTMAGIDPEKYSGFAAGFGVERFAMVIHGISDIRDFYKNDKRFLDQFPHFYDDGIISMMAGNTTNPLPDAGLSEETTCDDEQNLSKTKMDQSGVQPHPNAGLKNVNTIDISKLDIRVGVITKAWDHEEADKLFCEEIDIGEEKGSRQIASGLRAHYKAENLVGQRVLVLSNLKPRKLVGFLSHGMVICASNADESKVEFIVPPANARIGERVMCDGFKGEPATENQIDKKKMLNVIFPDLKTDGNGVATYRGIPLSTDAGVCLSMNKMSNSPIT